MKILCYGAAILRQFVICVPLAQKTPCTFFFCCSFAIKLWSWLASTSNMVVEFNSMEDIWKIYERSWSPQCQIVVSAAIINLINTIWFARNEARFNNKHITWQSTIAKIIAATSLSGNHTNKVSNNSVRDFTILKSFRVTMHHPKAPTTTEVLWQPPPLHWLKCNTNGTSFGNPGTSACGGIFRDFEGNCKGCFAEFLGLSTSYQAELLRVIRAIEITYDNNWTNLWIESDSSLVV